MKLRPNQIRVDGGTQPRALIDERVVDEYRADMMAGAVFPPVTVFFDGADYWLADGFHRVKAAQQLGVTDMEADVRQGTRRDAVLFSASANAAHGLRRTNEDKRRAVMTLLNDAEWSKWSNRVIAEKCGVGKTFVDNLRKETLSGHGVQIDTMPRTVHRNGTTYTMNTAAIGGNGHKSDHALAMEKLVERELPEELMDRAQFVCPKCYDIFDSEVWHCPNCDHHWPMSRTECANCHAQMIETESEIDFETGEILVDDQPQYEETPSIVERKPMAKASYITLETWNTLGSKERELLLTPQMTNATFNSQKNDNIEWARWSWNPVTGCKHDCPYCYARDIANRFYEQRFEPSFLPDRLCAPQNTAVPQVAATDIGYKNVFTCSMADLFGRWVPTEWIESVLDAVRAAPQWNFLFLTKFPIRLSEFEFPDNAWVGTTVDCQARVKNAENAFRKVKAAVKWLSCEPLLEPLEFSDLGMFQWIVIGGSSASSKTPEWHPPREWVNRIEDKARSVDCKVYEKTNLLERIREYPGGNEQPQSLPQSLRYLPSIERGFNG